MIKLEEELYFDKILGPIFITYYGKTESDEQNDGGNQDILLAI